MPALMATTAATQSLLIWFVLWWIWAPLALIVALICILLTEHRVWPYIVSMPAIAVTAGEQVGRYLASSPEAGDAPSPTQKLVLLICLLALDGVALVVVALAARSANRVAPRSDEASMLRWVAIALLGAVLIAYFANYYWIATSGS